MSQRQHVRAAASRPGRACFLLTVMDRAGDRLAQETEKAARF
jgi:hypothetical protein